MKNYKNTSNTTEKNALEGHINNLFLEEGISSSFLR